MALRRWCTTLALAIALAAPTSAADATDDRRALVTLRVLAYDKNLGQRVGDEVRIVIASSADGAAETARWTAAFAKIKKVKVDGRPISVVAIKAESADALARSLAPLHAAAIIVCDGLARKISVAQLAKLTRTYKVLSFTTREAEVASGLAVGIVAGQSRDEIVINVRAVAGEGVKFDAGLLALARVVKEQP
jgi:hypothetical protein